MEVLSYEFLWILIQWQRHHWISLMLLLFFFLQENGIFIHNTAINVIPLLRQSTLVSMSFINFFLSFILCTPVNHSHSFFKNLKLQAEILCHITQFDVSLFSLTWYTCIFPALCLVNFIFCQFKVFPIVWSLCYSM